MPDGMGLEYISYEPFTGNFKLFEGKSYRITVNAAVSYEQYHMVARTNIWQTSEPTSIPAT